MGFHCGKKTYVTNKCEQNLLTDETKILPLPFSGLIINLTLYSHVNKTYSHMKQRFYPRLHKLIDPLITSKMKVAQLKINKYKLKYRTIQPAKIPILQAAESLVHNQLKHNLINNCSS